MVDFQDLKMTAQPNVRKYYKLIQCLHHQSIAAHQQTGNWSKAFRCKNQQLNDFIRPAYPNQTIENQIKEINANWTKHVLDALHSHYTQSITELTNSIRSIDIPNKSSVIEIALARAKRNFGKKLRLDTIRSFSQICKDVSNSQNDANKTPPHKPAKSTQVDKFPKPSKSNADMVNVCRPNDTITSKQQNTTEFRYNTRSSTKHNHPVDTSATIKGTFKNHAYTKDTFVKWKLESITHPTFIIGDSNLKNIKHRVDNVQIDSFPGAKIKHITDLVNAYPNSAYKPDNVIVSVGVNDYNNKFETTTKDQIDKLCGALSKKFPSSRVYIPQLNVPETVSRYGTQNLNKINHYLAKKTKHITVIPVIKKEDYILASDDYHWTHLTGNKFLRHWLNHLNQ